jgi:hypothetical protein
VRRHRRGGGHWRLATLTSAKDGSSKGSRPSVKRSMQQRDSKMQLAPSPAQADAVFLIEPLALAVNLQTRAVDQQMQRQPAASLAQPVVYSRTNAGSCSFSPATALVPLVWVADWGNAGHDRTLPSDRLAIFCCMLEIRPEESWPTRNLRKSDRWTATRLMVPSSNTSTTRHLFSCTCIM